MTAAWFVTGTDTEVGKTHASCALLHLLRRHGRRAVGMKPVAAGTDAEGRNDDVERLLRAGSLAAPRELVNPYCFAPPVAPHVAARDAGVKIEIGRIKAAFAALAERFDAVVVEGVGGFRVPLDEDTDTADLAQALELPVILVVGIRLGCLNHALLTMEAIARRELRLAGWIANAVDPRMERPQASIDALHARLPAPLLGELPWSAEADVAEASKHLSLPF